MKPSVRNFFTCLGLGAIIVMICTFDSDTATLMHCLKRAGLWLPAIVALWAVIYLMNAIAWRLILSDGEPAGKLPLRYIYKLTVSGYALNYVTPVGLLGGEPYRILELTPHVGADRAASSVILYAMTHIFSHFVFWLFSVLLYVVLRPVDPFTGTLLAATGAFSLAGIYFFLKGYNNGMVRRSIQLLTHVPLIGKRMKRFAEAKDDLLRRTDSRIAALHRQRRLTFMASLGLEFGARIIGCLEVYVAMAIFAPISFADSIFVMAFTSLFANMLFFSPMQLGTREGAFALSSAKLSVSSIFGVYASLIIRVREIIWICIGILLIKINPSPTKQRHTT